MKIKSLLYLAALSCAVAVLAAPKVVVNSISDVRIDGADSGTVVDALANGGDKVRGPLLDALMAYESRLKDALAQDKADYRKLVDQDKAAEVVAFKAQVAKDVADRDAAHAAAVKAEQDARAAGVAAAEAKAGAANAIAQQAKQDQAAAEAKHVALAQALGALNLGAVPADLRAAIQEARQTEGQKRKAAMLAQKAALEAELAKAGP